MEAFAVTYRYTDLELRARFREEHLGRLRQLADDGQLLVAGPLPDASGAVIVLLSPSLSAVEELMRTDVYTTHGVLVDLSITPFTPAVLSPRLTRSD